VIIILLPCFKLGVFLMNIKLRFILTTTVICALAGCFSSMAAEESAEELAKRHRTQWPN